MKTAAFFDIDGTLCRNALMIEHFKKMVKYEVIEPSYWHHQLKPKYNEWRKRTGDYEDYMLELAKIYVDVLRGTQKSDLKFILQQVIALHGDIVYRFTRARIKKHKQNGDLIFFISGSPDFLVAEMAFKYQITDYRASIYETDENGIFTGEVRPMWDSYHKKEVIESLQKSYDIDLSQSYAYGDTNGDYTMLSLVGHPTAINPTRELIEKIKGDSLLGAKAVVVVERKDVIYEFGAGLSCVNILDDPSA